MLIKAILAMAKITGFFVVWFKQRANFEKHLSVKGKPVALENLTAPGFLLDGFVGDGLSPCSLVMVDGVIVDFVLTAQIENLDAEKIDMAGSLIFPTFADCHTHLDKGHAWDRSENLTGDFNGALAAIEQDYPFWSAPDLRRRMDFGLHCSYVHGTSQIRTHLDTTMRAQDTSWAVFDELRSDWAGRVALQAAALTLTHEFDEDQGKRLRGIVHQYDGVPGMVCYMTEDLGEKLDRVFAIAMDLGTDLDFHVDETMDPGARSLEAIADTAIRLGYEGRITCGHCCSLSQQGDETVRRVIDKVTQANISIVSLPMCNLYLQDRHEGRTPRGRGVTLLHEFKAAGVDVAAASDNCRDGFYAYGDHDMLEVLTQTTRIAHLDRPVGDWPAIATTTPRKMMGTDKGAPLRKGAPADFVIFPARKYSELFSRSQHQRAVIRNGVLITDDLPGYDQLDDLIDHE